MKTMNVFGYFDDATQAKPAFDPGLNAPCPFCTLPVGADKRKTISLMRPGDRRSWFYRAHSSCYEDASDEEIQHIESIKVDHPRSGTVKSDWRGVFGSLATLALFIAAWALAYWVWFR